MAWVLVLGGVPPLAVGQSITYDDVVVVVNSNDSVSVALGNYFMAARSIPAVNLIPVDAPMLETIDASQFQLVKQQIKSYMLANSLVGPINYMVMMKGMPHRVGTTYCDSIPPIGCASLDAEMVLLFSPDSSAMLTNQWINNMNYGNALPHAYANDDLIYVTRITAHDATDAIALIDRSGPLIPVTMWNSLVIGDIQNPATIFTTNYFHTSFEAFFAPLIVAGWPTSIDTTAYSYTGQNNVACFLSADDLPQVGVPDLDWIPGGLSMSYTISAGASFGDGPSDPGSMRCADIIADGASGVRGEITVSPNYDMSGMNHTLTNYYVPGNNLNLADSYFPGIYHLSRFDVIIGDPKTSLTISVGLGPDAQGSATELRAFPNPALDVLTVPIERSKVLRYQLLSMDGRALAAPALPTSAGPLSLSVSELPTGAYLLQLHTTEGLRMARFTVVR